ncbi:hypothetical protein [Haloferula sp.]|uniref:hypothetical protein n=1 Tax=Haloferula sp. TaxID=2497595 RepID=UPI00329E4FBE
MKPLLAIFSFGLAFAVPLTSHALSYGDVTVVGYNSSGTDAVAFTSWVDIPDNEEIIVTDYGYQGGGNGSGEGTSGGTYDTSENSYVVWENDTGAAIAAGTVIVVTSDTASVGSVSGNLQLTTGGEHFFLMQGSFNGSGNLIGNLLFGVDYDNSSGSGWDGGTETELPGAISDSLGNLFFDGDTLEEFTGGRTGKAMSAYQSDVLDIDNNWGNHGGTLSSAPFVDASVAPYLPGELMFLGWNANAPDTMSFVSWVDIPNGEEFLFIDAEYDQATGDGSGTGIFGGYYASAQTMTWRNNEGVDLPAGTVVVVTNMENGSSTSNVGTTTGGFGITVTGEQLFIGYGSLLDNGGNDYFEGDLIFGVDFEGGSAWGEAGESDLPSDLNVAGGNLSFGEQDAYEYSASRDGSPVSSYPAMVLNPSNWQSILSTDALDPDSFVETVIPPLVVPDELGQVSGGLLFHTRRMNNKDPIMDTQWLVGQGAEDPGGSFYNDNTNNLNGPSCVRLPSWLPANQRVDPTAEYYLYFADHGGDYIRMAWATNLEGPWTGYRMDEDVYGRGDRGVLSLGDDLIIDTGSQTADDHIASPDVFIDSANNRFVMYYHGKRNSTSSQRTFVATSSDGLNFNMPSGGDSRPGQVGHGSQDFHHGDSYFRVFEQDGRLFGLSNVGDLFAAPVNATVDYLASGWTKGPQPFTSETESRGWLDWGDGYGALRPRHYGVLTRDNVLYAFFTNKAASPERIKVSTFDFSQLPAVDDDSWMDWKGTFPNQELIRPEEVWEGVNEPMGISELGGETTPEHQLRDPDVFEDTDGRTYLFYSGAGEQGIGLAQLVTHPVVSGSTEVTTGADHVYTVDTDVDVTPSMLKISTATPVTLEFGAEDGEAQELVHAGNAIQHEQSTTVNDGVKAYQLAHDASGQSTTLTFPDTYYARPGTTLEFNSKMGVSSTGQFAEIQISFDEVTWQTLWIQQGGSEEAVFTQISVGMEGMEGRVFQMRFRYIHETLRNGGYESGSSSGRGWFFDQVVATGLETVTDIYESAFTSSSFTLDDITPVIDPYLTTGDDEDRFLIRVSGLHSGTGFSEAVDYGKPFVIRVRDSYEDYLEDNFTEVERLDPMVSGEGADPDGDGIVNLLEHAFGSDPKVADGSPVTIAAGAPATMHFQWNPDAGHQYQLQMGTNLDDFEDIDFTEVVNPSGELLEVTLSAAPSVIVPDERAFFRIKVE